MRLTRLFAALLLVVASSLATSACEPPPDGGEAPDVASDVVDSFDAVDVFEAPRARIVTLNVRRLFDRTCDSGRCDNDDFEQVPSQQEYELRLQRIADELAVLDADVVLLQEVENAIVLDDLRQRMDPAYNVGVIGETNFDASLDVAVVSRGELVETKTYRDSRRLQLPDGRTSEFAREFLQVHLEIADEDLIVFSAHFKSKSNDDPERRLAEAQEAREIVDEVAAANPNALVVLGGDLNDTPGSPPLDALTANGGLDRAGSEQSADQMWTYSYRGNEQAIDHLLFAPTEGGTYLNSTAMSVRDPVSGSFADSDHAALKADFELY